MWVAALTPEGYGNFWDGTRVDKAHRVAYLELAGFIECGLELDHLCRNHACVNPDHLEAVSHSVNLNRGDRKTWQLACKRGHPLYGENLRIYMRAAKEVRICRECERTNHKNGGITWKESTR